MVKCVMRGHDSVLIEEYPKTEASQQNQAASWDTERFDIVDRLYMIVNGDNSIPNVQHVCREAAEKIKSLRDGIKLGIL